MLLSVGQSHDAHQNQQNKRRAESSVNSRKKGSAKKMPSTNKSSSSLIDMTTLAGKSCSPATGDDALCLVCDDHCTCGSTTVTSISSPNATLSCYPAQENTVPQSSSASGGAVGSSNKSNHLISKYVKTLSNVDKETLLEALKQMSPQVFQSISASLKKSKILDQVLENPEDFHHSYRHQHENSLDDEDDVNRHEWANSSMDHHPPIVIIDNNAGSNMNFCPQHSTSPNPHMDSMFGWWQWSSSNTLPSCEYGHSENNDSSGNNRKPSVVVMFQSDVVDPSVADEDVNESDGESSYSMMDMSEVLETPSEDDDAIVLSQEDRDAIKSIIDRVYSVKTRRRSVPQLNKIPRTVAFRNPSTSYDPFIGPDVPLSTSPLLPSSTKDDDNEDHVIYYEKVTGWVTPSNSHSLFNENYYYYYDDDDDDDESNSDCDVVEIFSPDSFLSSLHHPHYRSEKEVSMMRINEEDPDSDLEMDQFEVELVEKEKHYCDGEEEEEADGYGEDDEEDDEYFISQQQLLSDEDEDSCIYYRSLVYDDQLYII